MELSPRLYRLLVRPPLFNKLYVNKRIKSLLSPFDFHNKVVLDFGCGIGSNSFMFQPEYYIGIDCNDKRINYAKYLHKDYSFFTSQDIKLSIQDNRIDYVLIIAVLHHISSPEIGKYLVEFRRILKPKGKVIIIEPCFLPGSHLCNWCMDFFDAGNGFRSIA